MIGLVRVGAVFEEEPDDRRLPLLHGDDQRSLAHLVGRIDLRAEADQPFHRLFEADARGGDQRRVAVLAGKVRIGALVEQEAGPAVVAAIDGDDQAGVPVAVLGIDEPVRVVW